MKITDCIEVNLAVIQGKSVIRGTRITVELILREVSEGVDEVAVLEAYPHLTKADI